MLAETTSYIETSMLTPFQCISVNWLRVGLWEAPMHYIEWQEQHKLMDGSRRRRDRHLTSNKSTGKDSSISSEAGRFMNQSFQIPGVSSQRDHQLFETSHYCNNLLSRVVSLRVSACIFTFLLCSLCILVCASMPTSFRISMHVKYLWPNASSNSRATWNILPLNNAFPRRLYVLFEILAPKYVTRRLSTAFRTLGQLTWTPNWLSCRKTVRPFVIE